MSNNTPQWCGDFALTNLVFAVTKNIIFLNINGYLIWEICLQKKQ